MTVNAFAPAKINLSLHVTGQRPDGLHLLDSLVCFADIGDHVTVEKADRTTLTVIGPGAMGIPNGPENLVMRAAALFPNDCPTKITLHKSLPMAAGLGGGSADAAATLHAMSKLWHVPMPRAAQQVELGADVPVCVNGCPTRMTGIGETLSPIPILPNLFVVLVNAGTAVPTVAVFQGLSHKSNPPMTGIPDEFKGAEHFTTWLGQQRNDLEIPARQVTQDIDTVLSTLNRHGALLSRMSGSGGTCFALFSTELDAISCAASIVAEHSNWWIQSGKILA